MLPKREKHEFLQTPMFTLLARISSSHSILRIVINLFLANIAPLISERYHLLHHMACSSSPKRAFALVSENRRRSTICVREIKKKIVLNS